MEFLALKQLTILSDNVTKDENLRIEVTTPNIEVVVTNVGASVTFERISGGAGNEVIGFKFVDKAGNLSVELTQTIGGLDTVYTLLTHKSIILYV